MNLTNTSKPKNFLEQYEKQIAPKLQQIDIFIKTDTDHFNSFYIARLLYISEEEVCSIAKEEKIESFNSYNFFEIMKKGSSNICQLFKREIDRGCPHIYSKEDISYIYDIDIGIISDACNKIGYNKFTTNTLPLLFANIPITN